MHLRQAYVRQRTAHTIIELGMLSVLFVVFAIFSLDVGFVILGSQMNDAACRDAARAAAQGSDYSTSLKLAHAAAAAHRPDGYFVTPPKVDDSRFVYEDFAGNPPSDTTACVTVTTSTTVRIPAPVFFVNATFGEQGTISFSRTYTFPIVKTTLYL